MKIINHYLLILLFACLAAPSVSVAQDSKANALNFKMETLKGDEVDLNKYSGKVVMFVNVASKCGLTPQYEQLQELYDKYQSEGLEIVGVPCNQFGKQEPGSSEEIAEFCEENYGVQFDMLAKVDVNGDEQAALYKHLTSQDLKPAGQGPIKWNFEKFLVDRSGNAIARFSPRTKPNSKTVTAAIEKALKDGANGSGNSAAPYSHKSSKNGKTYYLFSKEVPLKNSDNVQTIYFFAKAPNNPKGTPVANVPDGKVTSLFLGRA